MCRDRFCCCKRDDLNSKRRRTPCYDGEYTKESGGIPSCRIAKGDGATPFTGLHRTLHKILPYVVCPFDIPGF